MQFTRKLRAPIKNGEITTSIRIWKRPHVKAGNRYRLEDGFIEVDRISEIAFDDITPALARASGFAGVADLLKTAKHGSGETVYLVEFHYQGPDTAERFETTFTDSSTGWQQVSVPIADFVRSDDQPAGEPARPQGPAGAEGIAD